MLCNIPASANHRSIRTTLVHFYILLQHYNILLHPSIYSPYNFHPTPFTSIRPEPGQRENPCLATSVSLLPLHRPGILTYHGMERNAMLHFALYHFSPSTREPGALCLCLATHVPPSHNGAFGMRIDLYDTATGGPSSSSPSSPSPLASHHPPFPLFAPSTQFSLSLSWRGVGGTLLLNSPLQSRLETKAMRIASALRGGLICDRSESLIDWTDTKYL